MIDTTEILSNRTLEADSLLRSNTNNTKVNVQLSHGGRGLQAFEFKMDEKEGLGSHHVTLVILLSPVNASCIMHHASIA